MSRVTVVSNDRPGGSETFLASFATALVHAGHQVTFLILRPSGRPLIEIDAAVEWAHGLPPLRSARAPVAVLRLLLRNGGPGREAIRRSGRGGCSGADRVRTAAVLAPLLATRPDVVHFAFSGIAVALEPVLDLLDGCRLVASCQGSAELVQPLIDPERRAALARVLPRMDAVHAVSGAMAAAVVDLGARPGSVGIVRPAVDVDRFSPRPAHRLDGPLRLVSVGRLVPLKGHDDLIDALGVLRRDGLDVRLTIVGAGPHHDALVARSHLLGLADRVELTGSQTPAQVADVLAGADLFVFASLSEGISNALLEAMATGVPVVTTDVGGTGEVVTHGHDGLLVAPGDPAALAAAVAGLADDPERRAALGRAARHRVEQAFSRTTREAEWASFYADRVNGSIDPSSPGRGR